MSTINTSSAFRLGCAARKRGEQGIVVLNFGSPRNLGTQDVPILGTRLFGVRKDRVTLSQIASSVEAFALGYQHIEVCDAPPANPHVPSLIIAIGTTNSKVYVDDDPKKQFGDNEVLSATYTVRGVQTTHGEEWARMVNSVNTYLSLVDAKSTIRAAGAYDAEFGISEWSSFAPTLAWAKAFDKSRLAPYYNFGSCDGCPTDPQASNWKPGHKQVMQRAYILSWDIFSARPLPQIYYANQAQQWANVRWYAHQPPYNRSMFINGGITSCLRVGVGCDITDVASWHNVSGNQILSPSQGWNALFDDMNNPIAPDNSPNTFAQPIIPWATDLIDQ